MPNIRGDLFLLDSDTRWALPDSPYSNCPPAMDSFSDSSRCDLDSITSTDSLHLITDEFQLRNVSTPDISNAELSRRVVSLELENERLRVDLENSRIELNAKIAANQGLKDKITELYIEAQAALQERLKLDNALKNANSQVTAAEVSRKWFHAQIHDLQASKNSLQMEISTYQQLVRQKHEVALTLTARCKQFNVDYAELSKKFRKERQELKAEIEELRMKTFPGNSTSGTLSSIQTRLSPDLSTKLETTEDELRDTKIELKAMEQSLLSTEVAKASLENALAKHRELIIGMEINVGRCEMEKDEAKNRLSTMMAELDRTKSEKDDLQSTLLTCRQEHGQVEQAIMQLKSQLNKMIAQYKLIKARNAELESKTALLQGIQNENKTLRSRSFAANSSLFKKLRDSKRKIRSLEEQVGKVDNRKELYRARVETDISLQDCLKRALERNKELAERLKSVSMAITLEESVDEGYGDGCAPSRMLDIPSPAALDPRLMRSISWVLASGENFLSPVQVGLDELRRKLEIFHAREDTRLLNSGQMSPASPRNNARSVA